MVSFGADMPFGSLDQIIQSTLRRNRQNAEFLGSHRNVEADLPALHPVALVNSLVAGNRIDHGLLAVQKIRGSGEVTQMGSRGFH